MSLRFTSVQLVDLSHRTPVLTGRLGDGGSSSLQAPPRLRSAAPVTDDTLEPVGLDQVQPGDVFFATSPWRRPRTRRSSTPCGGPTSRARSSASRPSRLKA